MGIQKTIKLFGSRRRTQVLLLLSLLNESYPHEIARLLSAPLFSIQQIADTLEREGLVVSRRAGVERRVTLNPRFFCYKELLALLRKLAMADSEIMAAAGSKRARPRRAGKEIT